mmetsp:Transcript_50055/g.98906  ORF Transcript_50055/g.98906 Transcript_50055/m.98906 type:complete len:439 (+) Transcript_50055:8-1324(+)
MFKILLSIISLCRLSAADDTPPCQLEASVRLLNGVTMPRVAFGTAGLPRGESHEKIISAAIEAGFRSFDTAQATEWYDETAVAKALNSSGVPRSEFFITTKIHPRDLTYDRTAAALARSVESFGGYVDLVLLHYPRCFPGVCTSAEQRRVESVGGWKEAWRALRRAVVTKQVKAVGLSNFDVAEVASVDPPPHVVQNWFDPFRQDRALTEWCRFNEVAYTSYSTLGGQWVHQQLEGSNRVGRLNPVFESPVIRAIADAHGGPLMVPAVVLSWALQRNVLVLPRSASEEHILENARRLLPHALSPPPSEQQQQGSEGAEEGRRKKTSAESKSSQSSTLPSVAELLPVFLTQVELERIDALDGAVDTHSECGHWASSGECSANPGYMLPNCGAACGQGNAPPLSCSGVVKKTAEGPGGGGGGGKSGKSSSEAPGVPEEEL